MKLLNLLGFLAAASAALAQDTVVSLVAPTHPVPPGSETRVTLLIANLSSAEAVCNMPATLAGRIVAEKKSWFVELRGTIATQTTRIAANGAARHEYSLQLPAEAQGRLVLEIDKPVLTRAVLDVDASAQASAKPAPAAASITPACNFAQPTASFVERASLGRFSTHEPVYFIYGSKAPGAKFQFSFKYRLLSDSGMLSAGMPSLRGLHMAFTQRSLWDIRANSSPFFDTSYMPELIGEWQAAKSSNSGFVKWLGQQWSVQHESNGRGGSFSRSLNMIYFRPGIMLGEATGWNLILSPKIYTYIADLSDNPDIAKYRGYCEFRATLGKNERPSLSFIGRLGEHGDKGSMQFDLIIPLRSRLLDFASFFQVQYFDGYGESLLLYNQRSSSVRAGFSLVR